MSGYQGFAPARRRTSNTPPGGPIIDLVHYVTELVNPIAHDEIHDVYDQVGKRQKTRHHRTIQPSLLDQLRAQVHAPAAGADEGGGSGGSFESGAPANVEALALLIRIEAQAESWCREIGKRPRATVEHNLRALVGYAPRMGAAALRMMVADVRGWHTGVRTVCDWQAPAWRPRAPCPACEGRNGLRVRLAEKTAMCVLCQARWTPETIGVLANHIRLADVERVSHLTEVG